MALLKRVADLFWQGFVDDIVRDIDPVAQLGGVRVKADQHPRAVEIGGFCGRTCVDQHGGGLDTIGFDAKSVTSVTKAGEHLAAHFPAIKLGCGVGGGGPLQGAANGIDVIAGHGGKVSVNAKECKHGALDRVAAWDQCGRA